MSGILYVALDDGTGWKMELAKELKAAAIDVDLNKADGRQRTLVSCPRISDAAFAHIYRYLVAN